MQFLENIQMKYKLLVMMAIPILGLVWFAKTESWQALEQKTMSEDLLLATELSVYVSSLVHELQKERGMSAGYLSSRGGKFASELPNQRDLTNSKLESLQGFMSQHELSQLDERFLNQLNVALTQIQEISNIRTRITGLDISTPQGIGYYTGLNGKFLGVIELLPKISNSGGLSNSASAYVAFLQSKERAGIERAVLAGVFAADYFAKGFLNKFQELMIVQDTYLNVFKSLGSSEQIAFFDKTLSGRAVSETQRMRQIALDRASTGSFGVDPTYWFQMQTEKINLLKTIEDRLSQDIKVAGHELSGRSLQSCR